MTLLILLTRWSTFKILLSASRAAVLEQVQSYTCFLSSVSITGEGSPPPLEDFTASAPTLTQIKREERGEEEIKPIPT